MQQVGCWGNFCRNLTEPDCHMWQGGGVTAAVPADGWVQQNNTSFRFQSFNLHFCCCLVVSYCYKANSRNKNVQKKKSAKVLNVKTVFRIQVLNFKSLLLCFGRLMKNPIGLKVNMFEMFKGPFMMFYNDVHEACCIVLSVFIMSR